MPTYLRTTTGHGVTTLTLDSPANRNALSTPLVTELRTALATAVADPAARVVVLDHTGPVFCSGVDLAETAAARADGSLPVAALADLLAELWECPKPLVAKVGGPVRAGGLGLVAAADVAVAATEASFAFTEVRLGVVPAVISAIVLRKMNRTAAARYYLTGEVFDPAAAVAAGLVSEAVPAAELGATVDRVCQALVRGAPAALAGAKALLRREAPPVADELASLSEISIHYFRSADAEEGSAAFRAKRAPAWLP